MGVTVGVIAKTNNQSGSGDKFTALGEIERIADNEFNFSLGFAWIINAIAYANAITFKYIIERATDLNFRTDIAFVDTNNQIKYLAGDENIIAGIPPVVPVNCLLLGTWSIYGDTISDFQFDSGFITVTKAQLDDLIINKALQAGYFYKVTGVDVNLYGGTTIFIQALTDKKLASKGFGEFFNPKYDQLIDGFTVWSNLIYPQMSDFVGTFEIGEYVETDMSATGYYRGLGVIEYIDGDWSDATYITGTSGATCQVTQVDNPSYAVDELVIHGGKHWMNVDGLVSNAISDFELGLGWELIPFDENNYNVVYDEIEYDYSNDLIISRKDLSGNCVKTNFESINYFADTFGIDPLEANPIKYFQWGNDYNHDLEKGIGNNLINYGFYNNINFNGNAILNETLYQYAIFHSITYSLGCVIFGNSLNKESRITDCILGQNASLFNNIIESSAFIFKATIVNGSSVDSNILNQQSSVINIILNGTFFRNNRMGQASTISLLSTPVIPSDLNNLEISSDISITENLSLSFYIFQNCTKKIINNSEAATRIVFLNNANEYQVENVDA